MIDKTIFGREMLILQGRFGLARELTREAIARYHEYLSERLTTEQFISAARIVFDEHDFWPSPKRFAEVITGRPEEKADLAWRAVIEAVRTGSAPPKKSTPELTAAFNAAPFMEILAAADDHALTRLQRRFTAAYVDAALDADRGPQLEDAS